MKTLVIILLMTNFVFAQTVYEIPFASKGNEIELEILNDSELDLTNVAVSAIEKPDWISFNSIQEIISELKPNQNGKILFNFDVDKEAQIMDESFLNFQVSGNNQVWEKEIKISVLPPDKFELNQNYPNPFNPTTTISYTIPASSSNFKFESKVQLNIYDILGRHVETIINEQQKPGYYKYKWNADHLASGIYIYQVSIKELENKVKFLRKKMILMK